MAVNVDQVEVYSTRNDTLPIITFMYFFIGKVAPTNNKHVVISNS